MLLSSVPWGNVILNYKFIIYEIFKEIRNLNALLAK